MKNSYIAFLVCLFSICYGDAINDLLSKAVSIKNTIDGLSNNGIQENLSAISGNVGFSLSNTKQQIKKKETNPLKFSRRIPVLKRDAIFPKERVKAVAISPDGQKVAYLLEEGSNRYIKIIPSTNQNIMSQVIKEEQPISNFTFIGKNLVYTYYDEENNLKVKAKVSFSEKKSLELPENLKTIRFFKSRTACLAECYDGERYVLYKIGMNDLSCQEIKELSEPIQSLFDKNLNPFLIIKNENNLINIYVESKNKKEKSNDEDEVNIGSDDEVQRNQIDQIENSNLAKYFSVDNERNCYKASVQKPQNILIIEKVDPFKGTKSLIYKLNGVLDLSQCKINVDQNGKPSFITISSRRYQHFSWDEQVKEHIKVLNNKCGSWYQINATSDGMIWLVCVVNDKVSDKFVLYDTRTRNLRLVSSVNSFVNNSYLKAMECYFLHFADKEYDQMFLTRGVNSTSNSPLVLMTNSSGQYKWEYMPIVQTLANRGYNVLCLNYRKHDLSSGSVEDLENYITKSASDIVAAVNWAITNKIAKSGNIVLLSKKHSIVPAIHVLLKNQKSFSGLVAISPSNSDIESLVNSYELEQNSKPILFLGRFKNSESIPSLMEKISEQTTSIISSNTLINQKLMTGVIEIFLAKRFDNPNVENISQKGVGSLDVMMDGLSLIKNADNSHVIAEDDDKDEDLAAKYSSL